ncbi:MAG: shikimate dehydrogenase [bacterium]|nr:shikimate dehydrogenase [bacterium]
MKEIKGTTAVCGLIGNPVEHTLSPLIHNTLSELTGTDLAYVPFCVEKERVEEAVRGAYALSVRGLNVTVPHKSAVIPYLCAIDPLAEKIGAVNTLVRCEGGYRGYNTDMPGLYRALTSEGVALAGSEVLILGAGGVGRAVAMMCAVRGAARVYLLNRTWEKAKEVADEVREKTGFDRISAVALSDYRSVPQRKYLVIQATSVGMYPHTEEAVITAPDFYAYAGTGVDLIFNPAQTMFMKYAAQAGARTMNGLKMLLYQGILAYELWNDVKVSEEQAQIVYQKMKEAMNIHE